MINTILSLLVLWFLASIPVGLVVGRVLARASRATAPVPATVLSQIDDERYSDTVAQSANVASSHSTVLSG